jgi:hypothetical protein
MSAPGWKILTLWQPYASLVMAGIKPWETRDWSTNHRGTVLIHAGSRWTRAMAKDAAELVDQLSALLPLHMALEWEALLALDVGRWPRGAVLGRVRLTDCITCPASAPTPFNAVDDLVGDHSPGRQAWRFVEPERLLQPIEWPGGQSLRDVPDPLRRLVEGQFRARRRVGPRGPTRRADNPAQLKLW